MNRRSLFCFLAAAPFAAVAAKEVVMAQPSLPKSEFPIGYLMDIAEVAPDYELVSNHVMTTQDILPHQHTINCYQPRAVVRRKIFDGKQFVDFDSPAGAAVYNSLLAQC